MTGLPQDFGVSRRKPAEQPDAPIEVQLWQLLHEDARRMQEAARLNSDAVRFYRYHYTKATWLRATERHAAEQYAYVRYLMGIDDYWLTLERRATQQRPEWQRIQHGLGGVATPLPGAGVPPTSAPPPPVVL